LAAVGVSASVFNLVSKAFNVPLLNITTSFVAEEQALINREVESSPKDGNGWYHKVLVMSNFPGPGRNFISDVSTNSFDLMWVLS